MDPPSPMRRDLEQEEFLEDMINDNVDPAESPSSYLNPSGDGIEEPTNTSARTLHSVLIEAKNYTVITS